MGNRASLCKSCMNTCPRRNVRKCDKYCGFWQMVIFDIRKKRNLSIRASWDDYGISRERYRELSDMLRSDRYASVASLAAQEASEMLSPWILLSITKKRSYEAIEYTEGLGRIPCGRTDFYGYRRRAVANFNKKLKEMGKDEVKKAGKKFGTK